MAQAYATFAAGGLRNDAPPRSPKVVAANGGILYQADAAADAGRSPQDIVAEVDFALQKVVTDGTGLRRRRALGRPVAGKTGTTDGNQSAWFVGYTPQLRHRGRAVPDRTRRAHPRRR